MKFKYLQHNLGSASMYDYESSIIFEELRVRIYKKIQNTLLERFNGLSFNTQISNSMNKYQEIICFCNVHNHIIQVNSESSPSNILHDHAEMSHSHHPVYPSFQARFSLGIFLLLSDETQCLFSAKREKII